MSTNVSKMLGRPAEDRSSKGLRVGSWVVTGLFAAMMALSGAMYLIGPKPVVDAMTELGYPMYFVKMLGVAKLLGVVALVAPPKLPTLREWAYAGFTFDLLAAAISHVATGGGSHVPQPLFALVLVLASYFMRRRLTAESSS